MAAPTADAGSDQINIEPVTIVTLTGTDSDSDGTVVTRTWRQISGLSVVLKGTGATRTYMSPLSNQGATLVFGYQVTDNSGAVSTESTVTHTVLGVTERAVIDGYETPIGTKAVIDGGLQ